MTYFGPHRNHSGHGAGTVPYDCRTSRSPALGISEGVVTKYAGLTAAAAAAGLDWAMVQAMDETALQRRLLAALEVIGQSGKLTCLGNPTSELPNFHTHILVGATAISAARN